MDKVEGPGMNNPQVEENHYVEESYDKKCRFVSYWHQIDEVRKTNPVSVLEIGVGNGLVRDYLKRLGMNVTTLDIDQRLHPDLIGSVLEIPVPDDTFDTVTCFQVLEHLPFEDFVSAARELVRVSRKHVLLSLPDVHRVFTVHGRVPGFGYYQVMLPIPRIKNLEHQFDGEHYWEIGKARYSVGRIKRELDKAGLMLEHTFRAVENPYHRFFILTKS
jgi:SAM-dependent methyltransferase